MFAPRYFPTAYFQPSYFPPGEIVTPTAEEGGGDSHGRRKRYPRVVTQELYRQLLEAREIRETGVDLPRIERIEIERDIEAIAREVQARIMKIQQARYRKSVTTKGLKAGEILLAKQKAEALDEMAPLLMILLAEDL